MIYGAQLTLISKRSKRWRRDNHVIFGYTTHIIVWRTSYFHALTDILPAVLTTMGGISRWSSDAPDDDPSILDIDDCCWMHSNYSWWSPSEEAFNPWCSPMDALLSIITSCALWMILSMITSDKGLPVSSLGVMCKYHSIASCCVQKIVEPDVHLASAISSDYSGAFWATCSDFGSCTFGEWES